MRGLVYNVLGQEDVVDNAVAIVLLGRALVDAPVAIDDKLRASVSKSAESALPAAELGGRRVSRREHTLYCVLVLGSSTDFLKMPSSFSSWTVFFQSSKVPVT